MTTKRDYYEILDVSKDADIKDVKRKYRKMAMKYHPDRNPDNEAAAEKFREITEAYEVLSDTEKRQRYDQYGHAGVDDQMQDFWSRAGAGQGSRAFNDFGDVLGDVFGQMFGGGGGAQNRGADLSYRLDLSLEQANEGYDSELNIPRRKTCDLCQGSGAKQGTHPVPCRTCGGHGQVQVQQGFFVTRQTCPHCQGKGKKVESPCSKCRGDGRVQQKKKLKVRIPAGIYDGAQVRVTGEGESGPNGGSSGDLYIQVSLKEHPIFERDGADLHCSMPITFPQAALGAEVNAPTLSGKVKIKIPAGTESGKQFRLRGKGVQDVRLGHTGDLYVQVYIDVPKKLSDEQKELLHAFAEGTGHDTYPQCETFLDKVKKFWDSLAK